MRTWLELGIRKMEESGTAKIYIVGSWEESGFIKWDRIYESTFKKVLLKIFNCQGSCYKKRIGLQSSISNWSLWERPFQSLSGDLPCSYHGMHMGAQSCSLLQGSTLPSLSVHHPTSPTHQTLTLSSRTPESTALWGALLAQKPSPPRPQGPCLMPVRSSWE